MSNTTLYVRCAELMAQQKYTDQQILDKVQKEFKDVIMDDVIDAREYAEVDGLRDYDTTNKVFNPVGEQGERTIIEEKPTFLPSEEEDDDEPIQDELLEEMRQETQGLDESDFEM